MKFEKPEDFYAVYAAHRVQVPAEIRRKHIAEFDRNIWQPCGFKNDQRILEVGCGTGLFLAYLKAKSVSDFTGIDIDASGKEFMPADIAERVLIQSIQDYAAGFNDRPFDRIVLLDVFEHFSIFEGVDLLSTLAGLLGPNGQIVIRVPNAASPWGWQYQLGDLTHKAAYSPGRVIHASLAAELRCTACLPYRRASAFRRGATRVIEGMLNKLLTDPPAIWSANFVAVIEKP